jgi:hypothetical protein
MFSVKSGLSNERGAASSGISGGILQRRQATAANPGNGVLVNAHGANGHASGRRSGEDASGSGASEREANPVARLKLLLVSACVSLGLWL